MSCIRLGQKGGTEFLDAANYHLTKALVDIHVDCRTAFQFQDPAMSAIDIESASPRDHVNDHVVIHDHVLDDCKVLDCKPPVDAPECIPYGT